MAGSRLEHGIGGDFGWRLDNVNCQKIQLKAMDFFAQQEKTRKKTKWLVLYFILAVAAMIVAVYLAAILIFSGVQLHQHRFNEEQPQFDLWNAQLFIGVALGTIAVILIGSSYKTMALAAGGSAVSEMMGARLVSSNTADTDERKLLNVVEEMSIASGVPVPQVYVMDDEDGINAFAAGHKPGDATVTVTRGCMKLLSRDELQGVIGHEFSHILNGDMRLNLRLMGTIFGILCLAIIGRDSVANRAWRRAQSRTKSIAHIGSCAADHRLHRCVFWTAHPSRRQPPARISRRRLVRAVYEKSRRHHWRAEKNRRPRRKRLAPQPRAFGRIVTHVFRKRCQRTVHRPA
jgi:Zn-dependent protease with chaperone function